MPPEIWHHRGCQILSHKKCSTPNQYKRSNKPTTKTKQLKMPQLMQQQRISIEGDLRDTWVEPRIRYSDETRHNKNPHRL